MAVELQSENRVLTAILSGEIDHHAARPMRGEIDGRIEAEQPALLVLDFEQVTFMDSSGVGLVLGRHRCMENIGGKVIVRNPPRHIHRVFHLSGIQRIVEIRMEQKERREIL